MTLTYNGRDYLEERESLKTPDFLPCKRDRELLELMEIAEKAADFLKEECEEMGYKIPNDDRSVNLIGDIYESLKKWSW